MGAQDGPEDGQDRQGMEGDMMMEFSKVIEIACDKCSRRETYWYEVSASVKTIIASVRHIEGWSIGRKRCLCPRCKKEERA